jgi:hypothetical protein
MSMPRRWQSPPTPAGTLQPGRVPADISWVSIEDLEPAPGWVVRTDLRNERLVWLAAKPDLARMHRKWWHVFNRMLRVGFDGNYTYRATPSEHEDLSKSLQEASVIIDRLAGRFTAEEREVVRRTGLLPNWFWPAYLEQFDGASKRR